MSEPLRRRSSPRGELMDLKDASPILIAHALWSYVLLCLRFLWSHRKMCVEVADWEFTMCDSAHFAILPSENSLLDIRSEFSQLPYVASVVYSGHHF